MKKIGLIAGGGQFPLIFSKKARLRGFSIYAVAYRNEADPSLQDHVDALEWIHLGQIGRIIKFFKAHDVTDAVMMGAIKKTRMFSDIRPDIKAISLIARMIQTHDDGVLRAFASLLEDEGIRMRESTFLLPELLAPPGCWTRRKPTRSERSDIEVGWNLVKEIGRLDIGQCVVVGNGSVLAVEAIDGTDATITRGAKLGKGAVVVKACKPNQDVRFDIPAVGAQTIRTMSEAGAKVLTIEAGKTVVFDREEMIARANQHGMVIEARGQAASGERRAVSGERRAASGERHLSSLAADRQPIAPVPELVEGPQVRVGVIGVGYLGKVHASGAP